MADTVLDTLHINVDTNARDAEAGLKALLNTLSKFKSAADAGSSGMTNVNAIISKASSVLKGTLAVFKKAANVGYSWFKKSNDYVEAVNLFNVAMGDGARPAMEYAKTVERIAGIDLSQWLSYQGAFNQLAEGYGIASESANLMSKNLTQLSYDLSSLWNVDTDTAFQRLQSGMSGQIKGLKTWGINVSVAQLRQTALAHGIELSTAKMTEAQKATLRYITIMEQTSKVQGDLGRTITTPANSLRILSAQWEQAKRAMGQVISVVAVKVIPWFQALVQVIKEAAQSLADFFGYEPTEIDYSDISVDTSSFDDASDSLSEATENAKELKKSLLGIDELNVLTDNSTESASTELGGGYDDTFGLDLGQYDYDFLSNIEMPDLEDFKQQIRDVLRYAAEIGAAFASWKIASGIHTGLANIKKKLNEIKNSGLGGNFAFNFTVGGLGFLGDLMKLRDYIDDIKKNGANFSNVAGGISEGIGMIGDALIVLGNTKVGAGFKIMQGVGELVSSISDMSNEGVNWENVTNAIRGVSNIGIALGLLTGNATITGVSMVIQGITDCVNELSENWDAIKQGDWSGVDKATLVIGAIEVLGGIVTALGVFNKIKGATDTSQTTTALTEVSIATETINTTTSTLTSKMTSLVKNLALGIVVIAEVAVAAGLIVGAIWGLGVLLEQVGIAWQPVIDNGDTVAIAMGIGTGILIAVGVVTGLLGTAGASLIGYMALGTAMLALLGVNNALFLAEIWGIGVALEQIGIAWQPVIDNGDTIASAIGIGTGILVGIGVVAALLGVAATATAGALPLAIALGTAMLLELGAAATLFITEVWAIGKGLDELGQAWQPVLAQEDTISVAIETGTELLIDIGIVTAALGVATVASAGLLPLAIGLGTALLVELAAAFIEFCDSLDDVASKLTDLAPPLSDLNAILPGLKVDMDSFTDFMGDFAGAVVEFTTVSAIAGIAATVDTVIDFFTTDPIKRMYDEVTDQTEKFEDLIPALEKINPLIADAAELVGEYKTNMDSFQSATGGSGGLLNSIGEIFVDIKDGVLDGFKAAVNGLIEGINSVVSKPFEGINTALRWIKGIEILGIKPFDGLNTIDVPEIPLLASGGFPASGQMFIAREAGPEMVGTIGNKSAVVNNDQIVEGISEGVADANAEQNALLREQNALLRKLLEKDSYIPTYGGTSNIISDIERKNRRDGKTVISVG